MRAVVFGKELLDHGSMGRPFRRAHGPLGKSISSGVIQTGDVDCLKVDPMVHCPPEKLSRDSGEPGGVGTALVIDVGNCLRAVAPNPYHPAGNEREKLTNSVEQILQFQSIDVETREVRVPYSGGLVRGKGRIPPRQ